MNFNQNDYITSSTFLSIADVVFAANLSNEMFRFLKNKSIKTIFQTETYKTIKATNFLLKEGDIIYCNSSYLENLFYYLKSLEKLKNITLISGQSDRLIDKKIFQKKPACIETWFAVNVIYNDKNLIPIPLGIANEYSPKNIRKNDLIKNNLKQISKNNKLYVNSRKNTNLSERSNLEYLFKNKNWVVYKEPNLTINQYLNDISTFKFVLCPWGNGIDTHRLWESLYSGAVPVTKFNFAFKSFRDLPIIFVEKYEDVTLELLENEYSKLNQINLEILKSDYWKNYIYSKKHYKTNIHFKIEENALYEFLYWGRLKFFSKVNSKFKIYRYYYLQLLKVIKKLF